ncbi:hypothetical protein PHET_04311 [Paragonimus heterotremus]|uniref:UPF0506 domain-containing protein n=1 Tax=Paragonimus heterotremus TaxID=100268 RepID=A0A8J4TC42_9TREM|nr:hypothetical protein PHET_04311 [Paragonimus heterotremus]
MRSICLISLLTLVIMNSTPVSSSAVCFEKGMPCKKTVGTHCCGELVCHLTSPGKGTCKQCLPAGAFCFKPSECCSKSCFVRCK